MQLDIMLDTAGFPMIWVAPLNGYLSWLPATKIQLEYFLSATNDTTFDEAWYYRVNEMNPRIAPGQVNSKNLFQTLVTGVLPNEARRYALWCGSHYDLMTVQEWGEAFDELNKEPASPDYIRQITSRDGLRERPKRLIEMMGQATKERAKTLAEQMLMRGGVIEYVYESLDRNSYEGQGVAHSELPGGGMRKPKELVKLNNKTEGTRMRQFGFRLLHRGRPSNG